MIKKAVFFLALSAIFFAVLPTQISFAASCTGDKRDCREVCIDKNTICLNLSYPSFGGFNLGTNQDLVSIIGWLYYAIVTISGLAAFVMLVWGGIQWLTSSGNPGQIKDAQSRMSDALLGLGLVLGSYLILTIINPGLTTLEQPKLDAVTITEVISAPKNKTTPDKAPIQFANSFPPEETAARARINTILGSSGSVANTMGYCGTYTFCEYRNALTGNKDCSWKEGDCLNVSDLPEIMFDTLQKIKEGCLGCTIVITGGTESGHGPTHGPNVPTLDFDWNDNLATYLQSAWFASRICTQVTDSAYRKGDCDYDELERHLHVEFTKDYFANLQWSKKTASVGDSVVLSADTLLPSGQTVQVIVMDEDPGYDDRIREFNTSVTAKGIIEFSWEILQEDYDGKGGWFDDELEAYFTITHNGKTLESPKMTISR